MNSKKTYHQQQDLENALKLRELRSYLPKFLDLYFRGIDMTTESRTRIAYAVDLKTFFDYVRQNNPTYKDTAIRDFTLDMLDVFTAQDIEEYMEYLKVYRDEKGEIVTNEARGIKRKLSALRSMYGYFHKNAMIKNNPVIQVDMPKLHSKVITRLDADEVADLLDHAESGEALTKTQLAFHDKNKVRDLAMLTLLLGTGIRVSECVGLDIGDVDFDNDRIKIVRKGGYEAYVYFGDEVKEALNAYLCSRKLNEKVEKGHENALFLSSRNRRICVRNVEFMVKKYAQTVTTLKTITPHKLRSTYGTALYRETGDIYLVADVLGHKDVNTTKKHYAALDEDRRRDAKDKVKLRS
jgi:site-specific recombinase XerD